MSDRKWFETWFDTPYYHLLYNNRDDQEAQNFVSKLIDYLKLPKGSQVLDVACGKGRHSSYLAQLGYETVGLDLSPHSIAEAKKELLPNLHFEVWDMRKIYKENYFDLVVNLFSSFGYFDNEQDDQHAICAMAGDLKPGGILVMDYMNAECTVKTMSSRMIIDRGEVQFHIKKKIEGGFIKKEIEFLADGQNQHYQEQLKLIKPEQFQKLFAGADLRIKHVFGNYDLEVFDPSKSTRQVIIAEKLPHP
jgi:SAM-dependent methyltransferase